VKRAWHPQEQASTGSGLVLVLRLVRGH
jgi:hypothetical protein